ncbi:MAG: alpha/beta fold hydrolase [Oscillatoriales cyanobacterium]|nr:MAG: alpha/beta fold hydrolase [Oscillatoriales cyanobacterium]
MTAVDFPIAPQLDRRAQLVAAEAPVSQFWQWRGQAVHYVQAGTGADGCPPLLLVHGFGASTDHWRKNIADLQQDFSVWAIDLLGFGRSAKPDWVYSGELWQAQLQEFIEQVIGQPVAITGNSLGGYASLCVAANHPTLVRGVVLLNSAGPFTETVNQTQPKGWQKILRSAIQSVLLQPLPSYLLFQNARRKATIRKTLAKVYLDQSAVTDRLVEEIYRPSCDPGAVKVFASVFKAPRGENVDQLLGKLQVPLLLAWGEGDPWMKARARSEQFRRHYEAVDEYFLAAGHCPHDEVPEMVDDLIRQWVRDRLG